MARNSVISLFSFLGVHIALLLATVSLSTHYWITAHNGTMPNSNMTNATTKMKNCSCSVITYSKGLWKICSENTTTEHLHIPGKNHTIKNTTNVYVEKKCVSISKFTSAWGKLQPSSNRTVNMTKLVPANHTKEFMFNGGLFLGKNHTNHTSGNHTGNQTSNTSDMFNISKYNYTLGYAILVVATIMYYIFLCVVRAKRSITLAIIITVSIFTASILFLVSLVLMKLHYQDDKDFKDFTGYKMKLAWSFYIAAGSCAVGICSAIASIHNISKTRSSEVPYQNIQA